MDSLLNGKVKLTQLKTGIILFYFLLIVGCVFPNKKMHPGHYEYLVQSDPEYTVESIVLIRTNLLSNETEILFEELNMSECEVKNLILKFHPCSENATE